MVAKQRRHGSQEILGHANVDLRVVALALLRRPGRGRVEAPEGFAHDWLVRRRAVGALGLGRNGGHRHEPAGDVSLGQIGALELSTDPALDDHQDAIAQVGELLEVT